MTRQERANASDLKVLKINQGIIAIIPLTKAIGIQQSTHTHTHNWMGMVGVYRIQDTGHIFAQQSVEG